MTRVQSELLLQDIQDSVMFGRGQYKQRKGAVGILRLLGANTLRAIVTGHRQWTCLRLIEDMYNKQGTPERREVYRSMGRAMKDYRPVQ